jgi:uncharacterized membrane protein
MTSRFRELDALRGAAILAMVAYHILYDLWYFDAVDVDPHSLPLLVFARLTAAAFVLLVGVSMTLSYNRAKERLDSHELFGKFLRRGLGIFGLGALITVATYIALDEGYIVFGILHLIGLSIILAYPMIERSSESALLGLFLIFAGAYLYQRSYGFSWLLWLGLKPHGFYTLDYFPLLPWLGVVLIGIAIGNGLYRGGRRRYGVPDLSASPAAGGLGFLGRHSLFIYLLHQPIIIGVLMALGIAHF